MLSLTFEFGVYNKGMLKLAILTNGEYLTNIIYKLSNAYNVIVITHRLKPQGRGLKVPLNLISSLCKKNNIPCYEVENINKDFNILIDFKPDILLLCDFKDILSDAVMSIPRLTSLNIHPSLLPKYRGATPIQSALLNGDIFTGYSILDMDKKVDAGKIYYQEVIPIYEWDDFFTLRERIFGRVEDSIFDVVRKIITKELVGITQNEEEVKICRKFKKSDGIIHWEEGAQSIYRKLCAFKKWPKVYFYNFTNKKIEVVSACIIDYISKSIPGSILNFSTFGIHIQTGENILNVIKVKPEGKKIITALDYVNGYRLKRGDIITSN